MEKENLKDIKGNDGGVKELKERNAGIPQIYDKVFKKILTLSSKAVINLVNGLFDTDYPPDSTISYNWSEFVGDNLKRLLADTILTINGSHSYHMEAQMTKDDDIIFRVFAYGYAHAERNKRKAREGCVLEFPEPKIIYLYSENPVPDEYVLELDFGEQGSFLYRVPTFKFLDITTEELNRRKLVILIPFSLLKLRRVMKESRSEENLEALKKLIQDDILGSIKENQRVGNLTENDARRLKDLTLRLYKHIYSHYREMEELNEKMDESLVLDIDIIEKEHEKALAKLKEENDRKLEEKDREIAALKEQMKKLQNL